MTLTDVILIVLWALIFNLYMKMFPKSECCLYMRYSGVPFTGKRLIHGEDKYQICGAVHIRIGIKRIMEMAEDYDAVIIGDVPSHEENCLMKECFGSSISILVPKSNILLSSSAELNIFDSPLYLSRNEDLKVEQKFLKG